ncbi:DNA helicase INO80 [Bagarius yarrelli]|uniref:Chromatin-remodeling ATPase INO80 n=1 Tax=Bagarius yarrelli TaxID=175774 RepID=A0A556V2A1_BAGYA|nr:DNA helicase INO80 [Bagarius yarrelli]
MAPLSLLARLLKVAASLLLPSPPPQSLSLCVSAILETERRCETAAAETERKQGATSDDSDDGLGEGPSLAPSNPHAPVLVLKDEGSDSEDDLQQYQYYSVGLLSTQDPFYEQQRHTLGPKKKKIKEEKKFKAKLKKMKKKKKRGEEFCSEGRPYASKIFAKFSHDAPLPMSKKKHLTIEQLNARRRKVWLTIAKKEIPKAFKQKASAKNFILTNTKKAKRQQRKLNFLITQTELYAHFMGGKHKGAAGDGVQGPDPPGSWTRAPPRGRSNIGGRSCGQRGPGGVRDNIWGPFLIISPASTLNNWHQEFTRFVPKFKVLPYWGNPHDRKVIRKFWSQKTLYTQNAPFHVVITSYQLVVQDVKYFQRVKWQYMVLDEAQALKSSTRYTRCSKVWGTMLWALLHFIMPTLFDSHEEFNEWFSKDIESHAENKSAIDENQLSRLHMILKPFMLRRIKKDVENELSTDRDLDVVPVDQQTAAPVPGSEEQDLHRGPAAVVHGHHPAGSQHHQQPDEPRHAVPKDLFERQGRVPRSMSPKPFTMSKFLFRHGLLHSCTQGQSRLLQVLFSPFSPQHIHHSLFHTSTPKAWRRTYTISGVLSERRNAAEPDPFPWRLALLLLYVELWVLLLSKAFPYLSRRVAFYAVTAVPVERYCPDRSAEYEWRQSRDGGSLTAKQCFLFGSPELAHTWAARTQCFHPPSPAGLMALQPQHGWSFIRTGQSLYRGNSAEGEGKAARETRGRVVQVTVATSPGLLRGCELCLRLIFVTVSVWLFTPPVSYILPTANFCTCNFCPSVYTGAHTKACEVKKGDKARKLDSHTLFQRIVSRTRVCVSELSHSFTDLRCCSSRSFSRFLRVLL